MRTTRPTFDLFGFRGFIGDGVCGEPVIFMSSTKPKDDAPVGQGVWRERKRIERRALSQVQLENSAHDLCDRITALPQYQSSSRIGAYLAFDGEMDLAPLMRTAWRDGKTMYLPCIRSRVLQFLPYESTTSLRPGHFNIPEPDVSESLFASCMTLDLILVPLTAFDEACHRIGMGGGYYDRSLAACREARARPFLLGVAHDIQRVADIVPNDWDVSLDAIATDRQYYPTPTPQLEACP